MWDWINPLKSSPSEWNQLKRNLSGWPKLKMGLKLNLEERKEMEKKKKKLGRSVHMEACEEDPTNGYWHYSPSFPGRRSLCRGGHFYLFLPFEFAFAFCPATTLTNYNSSIPPSLFYNLIVSPYYYYYYLKTSFLLISLVSFHFINHHFL